jgi:hypothetical protein
MREIATNSRDLLLYLNGLPLYSILATQSSFQYLDIGETKGVPPQ